MQKPMITSKTILLTVAATAVISAVYFVSTSTVQASDSKNAPAKQQPALTVTVAMPQLNQAASKLAANGNVMAWQEASIGSESSGLRIENIYVNVGDVVKRGQLLASFASEAVKADVSQANAAFVEATAFAADAINNADRARGLQSSGAISKQQIGQYLTAEQTAKARVNAAKAVLEVQKLRLKYTQVVAPDLGTISARMATVGAVVGNGTELFRMIRQGRLEWRAEVVSSDLSKIKSGMEVLVTSPSGVETKGKVRILAPTVDAQKRTGLVYVDLQTTKENKDAFKSGMFAKGEFVLSNSSALTIPQQSVVVRDGFTYAFKLNADQRVTQIKLQTGRRITTNLGEQVEVLSGINPETKVVVSGAGFLNDGDMVKVVADVNNVLTTKNAAKNSSNNAANNAKSK
jgi:RND family efflux transporter MFP subunit